MASDIFLYATQQSGYIFILLKTSKSRHQNQFRIIEKKNTLVYTLYTIKLELIELDFCVIIRDSRSTEEEEEEGTEDEKEKGTILILIFEK